MAFVYDITFNSNADEIAGTLREMVSELDEGVKLKVKCDDSDIKKVIKSMASLDKMAANKIELDVNGKGAFKTFAEIRKETQETVDSMKKEFDELDKTSLDNEFSKKSSNLLNLKIIKNRIKTNDGLSSYVDERISELQSKGLNKKSAEYKNEAADIIKYYNLLKDRKGKLSWDAMGFYEKVDGKAVSKSEMNKRPEIDSQIKILEQDITLLKAQREKYISLQKELEEYKKLGIVPGGNFGSDDYTQTGSGSGSGGGVENAEKLAEILEQIKKALGSINEESGLKDVLVCINDISTSLGKIKDVLVDVGDGSEISPLLETMKKVNEEASKITTNEESKSNKTNKKTSSSKASRKRLLNTLYDEINLTYQKNNGKRISGYWNDLKNKVDNSNKKSQNKYINSGLMTEGSNLQIIDSGLNNSGGIIGEDITVIARKNQNKNGGESRYERSTRLKEKLNEAYEAGVNVARILDIIGDKESDVILEVQETQVGRMLAVDSLEDSSKSFVNNEYLEATDEQILKLIQDIMTLEKIGLSVDVNSTNLFYDKEKGFSFIDLGGIDNFSNSYEDMINDLRNGIIGSTEELYEILGDTNHLPLLESFKERFEKIASQASNFSSVSEQLDQEKKAIEEVVEAEEKLNTERKEQSSAGLSDEAGTKDLLTCINEITTSLESMRKIISDVGDGQEFSPLISSIKEMTSALESSISTKTSAFTEEESKVTSVIDTEVSKLSELETAVKNVTSAVEEKTAAFENEQKIMSGSVDSEVQSLSPLQNLENTFSEYKKFYNNNDLESKAGAEAALAYFYAYKNALNNKINKKDLIANTIGNTDSLFTGNYNNYKKGVAGIDVSGINAEISKYQDVLEKLNNPEIIATVNSISEAIEKLLSSGNTSDKTVSLLQELNNTISSLGGKNGEKKLENLAANLEKFQKAVSQLNITDDGFIKQLNAILEKGDELKALGEVLKSSKKQIDNAVKGLTVQEKVDEAHEILSSDYLNIKDSVTLDVANRGGEVLSQTLSVTKDGLIQIIALIHDANDAYQKFIYTTSDGENINLSKVIDDDAKLSGEVKKYEAYKKLQELTISNVENLGNNDVVFTPESENWDKLIQKAEEFGIKVQDIEKIIRTVDKMGNESFQIFTDLSRITIGTNSKGILYQKETSFDKSIIEQTKKDINSLKSSFSQAFSGDNFGTEKFLSTVSQISEEYQKLVSMKDLDLISDEELADVDKYANALQEIIVRMSVDKLNASKLGLDENGIKSLRDDANIIGNIMKNITKGNSVSNDDLSKLREYINLLQELNLQSKNDNEALAGKGSVNKLRKKISQALNENTKHTPAMNQFREDLKKLRDDVQEGIPISNMQKFGADFEKIMADIEESGDGGLSIIDKIKGKIKDISSSFIAQYLSFQDIVRYIRNGITTITELDTAFTEMRKVSNESVQSLKAFQEESFNTASAVGTTAQQIQNSTADWMKFCPVIW